MENIKQKKRIISYFIVLRSLKLVTRCHYHFTTRKMSREKKMVIIFKNG